MNELNKVEILEIEDYPEVKAAKSKVDKMEQEIQNLNESYNEKLTAFEPGKTELEELLVKRELDEVDNNEIEKTSALIKKRQKELSEIQNKLENELPPKTKALEILRGRLNDSIENAKADRIKKLQKKIESIKFIAKDQLQSFEKTLIELRDIELIFMDENGLKNPFILTAIKDELPRIIKIIKLLLTDEFRWEEYSKLMRS